MASSSNSVDAKPTIASMNDFTHTLKKKNMSQTDQQANGSQNVDNSSSNVNNNEQEQQEDDEEMTLLDRWKEQTPVTQYTVIGAALALISSVFFVSLWVCCHFG